MSLYFIFTIDGDWDEYFLETPKKERKPHKKGLEYLIRKEISAARAADGKFLHFVHTSPVARAYFSEAPFISLWKEIESGGGSVGVHCHEEGLFKGGSLTDEAKLDQSVRSVTEPLRAEGINLISYRGGYMTFCEKAIPVLEKNGLKIDFSCAPGRYLHHKGRLISDWRRAPKNYYRMCYSDHRIEGQSKVVAIPLGKLKRRALYIDLTSLADIRKVARRLAAKGRMKEDDIIVSVLTHTYEFSSFWKRVKIKLALLICKRYGTFINDREALGIIRKRERKDS